MRIGFVIILLLFCISRGISQDRFSFTFHETPVKEVFEKIEQQTGYIFSYAPSVLNHLSPMTLSVKQANLEQILAVLFKSTDITWEKFGEYIILKKRKRFFSIYGRVYDKESRERLIGASVYDPRLQVGATTNNYGFYTLLVPEGAITLYYSYVGYRKKTCCFTLKADTMINIGLHPTLRLEEVTVTHPTVPEWVRNIQPGQLELPVGTANVIPQLLGENDLLKVLQLFPGVRAGVEGMAGLFVRGGNRDENQFLIDDIPLYNTDHLLGFFSAFNSNAVKSVNFYKSGFPARYGGHLSSVTDIRLKEGNMKEYHGNFSIGLLASKFNVEGPIEKERSSFNISVRRTYWDLIGSPIYAAINNSRESKEWIGYNFTDVSIKLTRKFSEQNTLSFIFFWGDDHFNYKKDEKDSYLMTPDREKDHMQGTWGNLAIGLRWDKMINPGLYVNTVFSYNRYRAFMNKKYRHETYWGDTIQIKKIHFDSSQEEWRVKSDFTGIVNRWNRFHFGGHYIYHVFIPEKRVTFKRGEIIGTGFKKQVNHTIHAHEVTVYAEDEISVNERLTLYPGVRGSLFCVENKNYFSFEPRFSTQYRWNDHWIAKASYSVMSQYVRQLRSSMLNMPTDLWIPANDKIKPMKLHQCVLGIYYHPRVQWHLSLEGFYKTSNNLVEDYNGLDIIPEYQNWEENIHLGKGRAYGLEWMLQKAGGKTNGWMNYTLSRSYRWYPDGMVNRGQHFPAKYDSRHIFNIVLLHKFSDFFDVSAIWTFNNGFYTTQPLERYDTPTTMPGEKENDRKDIVFHIEKRNNLKTPDYHRLDVGFNFHRRRRHGISTWSINLYNAYCRLNTIELSPDLDTGYNRQKERQYFSNDWLFPIIPSFSYTFTF